MQYLRRSAAFLVAASSLAWGCRSASALTNADIAGVYQGTSVVTLTSGATVTANLTITLKSKGNIKTVAVVNGQTTNGKGKYQFVSEHGITETTNGGEALGFVDLNGSTLTLNLLVRLDSGEVLKEVTTVTRVQ